MIYIYDKLTEDYKVLYSVYSIEYYGPYTTVIH